jgi:predicted lipoprotein with Yx(FWY)xxD motif
MKSCKEEIFMKHSILRFFLIAFFIGAAALAGAQSMTAIQVATSPDGVNYLTDDKGMTLYYYTLDTNGQSACYGGCAKAWPIFYAPKISVPDSLDANDFGTITRTDGTRETTYKGWPLYYWVADKKPGDMTGEDVHHAWYILKVPAYTVMLATSSAVGGNYLVDGAGATLYYFAKDSAGMSACTGDCLKAWPAFTASAIIAPSAVNASDFGAITRDDGTAQVTFKGYPLYYWMKDKKRGDVTGQGVGKAWYVVDPAKFDPGRM